MKSKIFLFFLILIINIHGASAQTATPTFTNTPTPIPTSTIGPLCASATCNQDDNNGQMNCLEGFLAGDSNYCQRPNLFLLKNNKGGFTCPTSASASVDAQDLILCDDDPGDGFRWIVRQGDLSWEFDLSLLPFLQTVIDWQVNGSTLGGEANVVNLSSLFSVILVDGELSITLSEVVTQCGQEVGPTCLSAEVMLTSIGREMVADSTVAPSLVPADALTLGPNPDTFGAGGGGIVWLPKGYCAAGSNAGGPCEVNGDCPSSTCTTLNETACTSTCNDLCTDGCTWSSPTCTCKLAPNSHFGAFTAAGKPSVYLTLGGLFISENWRLVIGGADVGVACTVAGQRRGGQLTVTVRGDMEVRGEINTVGAGQCGVNGGAAQATTGGRFAGWTSMPFCAAGNNTGTAGAAHTLSVLNLQWYPGDPLPFLAGAGGGGNPTSGGTFPLGFYGTFVGAHLAAAPYYMMLGGSGGCGGGCGGSPIGSVVKGGNGGGGVVIKVARDLTFGASAVLRTDGEAGGAGGAGGGAGSALLIVGGEFVAVNPAATFSAAGGAAGSTLTGCGANSAGMAGQQVVCSMSTGTCSCLWSSDGCASY